MLFASITHILASEANDSVASNPFDKVKISLLTCEPHDQVYSLYGHTALRIQHFGNHDDITANWGIFDPEESMFIPRFVLGLTDYMLGIFPYEDFRKEYEMYGCAIYEQELNLCNEEKAILLKQIIDNARPENIHYRYNFLYNNCTTRARDVITSSILGQVEYTPTYLQEGEISFRELIHLKNIEHPWARYGNDLLLGVYSDANTTHDERQFLPEILMNDLDSACIVRVDGLRVPLVKKKECILPPGKKYVNDAFSLPLRPILCAGLYLCVILAVVCISYFFKKKMLWTEFFITLIYSIIGIVLFIMIFSKHPTVNINLQILIFNPFISFFFFPKFRRKYSMICVAVLCLAFLAGNAIQSYAEGNNVMALALLILSLAGLTKPSNTKSAPK